MLFRSHLKALLVAGSLLLCVETTTGAATPAFDIGSVPVQSTALPEFPFIDWPEFVPADARVVERKVGFDALPVITGSTLLTLEGRLEERSFAIPEGRSAHELRRYYRDRIGAFGGVQVNRLQPTSDAAVVVDAVAKLFPAEADPAKRLDLCAYDEGQYQYEVYLARSATTQAWIVVQTSTYTVCVTSVAVEAE